VRGTNGDRQEALWNFLQALKAYASCVACAVLDGCHLSESARCATVEVVCLSMSVGGHSDERRFCALCLWLTGVIVYFFVDQSSGQLQGRQ
jgi:hypothetical protein